MLEQFASFQQKKYIDSIEIKIIRKYIGKILQMSVRRASESLRSSNARKTCIKHSERIATHQLVGKRATTDAYYCQKCSIMLASQGYNVIKLNSFNPINQISIKRNSVGHRSERSSMSSRHFPTISNRKNQISFFVEGLNNLYVNLEKKNQCIQDYLIKSQNEHGAMIEQASRFYEQIQELIELQKYTTYNSILSKRALEEAVVREIRQQILEAVKQVEAMMNDIRQNMDAVQTVDYSIYNAIMGGYHTKIEKVKELAKDNLQLKSQQKCFIVLPEIPKQLYTLSDKISISFQSAQYKSNTTTNQNSINVGFKPHKIVTEQDICISEPSQDSNQNGELENKENHAFQARQPTIKMGGIMKSGGNMKQLVFSFDQNANNSKELRINEDESFLRTSKYNIMKGFEQGKLSKIEERLNSKQVYESRESLGEYLDISQSRQRNTSLEDAQTLLIS